MNPLGSRFLKRMLASAAAVAVLALGASGTASAQASHWYLGIGGGQSSTNIDMTGISGSSDETDTGWKAFGGYQFNQYIGAEVGYVDLGSASFNGTLTQAIPPFPAGTATNGSFDSTAWFVTAVGSLPFGQNFAAIGKLGLSYSNTDAKVTVGGVSGTVSGNTTEATYGLGLRWDITNTFAARAEWDRFRVGGGDIGDKSDVDLFSINAIVKF
jgi:OOP family OmpA-OmpF porin